MIVQLEGQLTNLEVIVNYKKNFLLFSGGSHPASQWLKNLSKNSTNGCEVHPDTRSLWWLYPQPQLTPHSS